jgi:hypothetical protein
VRNLFNIQFDLLADQRFQRLRGSSLRLRLCARSKYRAWRCESNADLAGVRSTSMREMPALPSDCIGHFLAQVRERFIGAAPPLESLPSKRLRMAKS